MSKFMRLFWLLNLSAFLITANGCSTNQWVPINEVLEHKGPELQKESGQSIAGYQLNDGPQTKYVGKVRLAAQDSLVFWKKEKVAGYSEGGKWIPESRVLVPGPTYPLDAVKTLKVPQGSAGKTVLLVLAIPASLVGLLAASMHSSNYR